MSGIDWLPEELHTVAMRLARADELAYRLAEVGLAWSRGPDDEGALTIQQVERTPGFYDVEVSSIRPVPPIAAMLFSEAIHHLRSAVDNVVFYLATREHGQPLTASQERAVSMLVYEDETQYQIKLKSLAKQGLKLFQPDALLGQRIHGLQPFNDLASVPSMSPLLAVMMGIDVTTAHPLLLLRDYSNMDKHRAIRLAAGKLLVQRQDDWKRSVNQGMREVEVGTVLEVVKKGVLTPVELSAALHVQRPAGEWVAFGPELDGVARHLSDIVIPTLVTGIALPGGLPVDIALDDTGETFRERSHRAGTQRAHERVQQVMQQALIDAEKRGWNWAPTVGDGDGA